MQKDGDKIFVFVSLPPFLPILSSQTSYFQKTRTKTPGHHRNIQLLRLLFKTELYVMSLLFLITCIIFLIVKVIHGYSRKSEKHMQKDEEIS